MIKFRNEEFNNKVEKNYKQYKILLIPEKETINISIQNNSSNAIFESDFNIEYLHKILMSSFTIKEIIDFISTSINKKNIEIKENKMNLKLIFISSLFSNQSIELIIKKKIKKSEENLNSKILNCDIKKKEIEEIIKHLEKYNIKQKKYVPKIEYKLNKIKTINSYNGFISSISSFPSGNIISVSYDKSIKIFDNNFNLIQIINNAHDSSIFNIDIQNENNFVTCSADNNIKTWIKNNNNFKLNNIIENAHNNTIYKVIYDSKGNLYSCSYDKTVKKWEFNNNKYQNVINLNHNSWVNSILLLENMNLLISTGEGGTRFFNINNYECIYYIKDAICNNRNALCKIDNDKIIIGAYNFIKIISLKEKKVIKIIDNCFRCWGINVIDDKGIFIIGGKSKVIKVYRNDNFECIQTIENGHKEGINGFCELYDKSIISFSDDKTINLWKFN